MVFKFMKKIFILVLFIISLAKTNAQVNLEWTRVYDNGFKDVAMGMVVTKNGDIYTTGESFFLVRYKDWLTLKYNSSGTFQWSQRFDGLSDDTPQAIALDSAGNIYVTGMGDNQMMTIKYTSSGNRVWIDQGAFPGGSGASAISAYKSECVFVAGWSKDTGQYCYSTIVKYDSSGLRRWTQRYNEELSPYYINQFSAVSTDELGNSYATGTSYHSDLYEEFITRKYDINGDSIWTGKYNSTSIGWDFSKAITVDKKGNAIVSGINTDNVVTLKYDSSGHQKWVQFFPSDRIDDLPQIVSDDSGNVYVTCTGSSAAAGTNIVTVKYSPDGIQRWIRSFDGGLNLNDYAYAICIDESGAVYVTGSTWSNVTAAGIVTIKYSSSGNQLWEQRFPGTGSISYYPVSIGIDSSSNIYVFSRALTISSGDYVIIKYSQTVDVNSESEEFPETFMLMQNYPNPFNPGTSIRYQISKPSLVTLTVYDITGSKIRVLVNEKKPAGNYEIKFKAIDESGNELPSGVYFYRLETDNEMIATKRMLFVK